MDGYDLVFYFVLKLPDPKINKICASKTKKAALLKCTSKNLKIPFSSCNKQLTFFKGKWKNLNISHLWHKIPPYHLKALLQASITS